MVSYLKILQCKPKLWTGQENLDGRPNALTHSHCGDYVEITASELNKNHLTKKDKKRSSDRIFEELSFHINIYESFDTFITYLEWSFIKG